MLGSRECRREHDGSRMKHRTVVHVVLLGNMRGGGVDDCRKQRRGRFSRHQDFRATVRRTHEVRESFKYGNGALVVARKRGTHPIDEEIHRAPDHVLRDVFIAECRSEGCEHGTFLAGRIFHGRVLGGLAWRDRIHWVTSERPRQPEDVLGHIGQDEIGRDRRDLVEPRFAELALDIVVGGEAEAAVELDAGVRCFP